MIIIGLLLLAAAAIFGVDLVFGNHHHHVASPAIFGQGLGLHSEAAVFILGAIVGVAALVGLMLIVSGIRHQGVKAGRQTRQRRDLGAVQRQRDDLAAQNESLRGEVSRQQSTATPAVRSEAPVPPAGPPAVVSAGGRGTRSAVGNPGASAPEADRYGRDPINER